MSRLHCSFSSLMILDYCLLKHHVIKAITVYKVWYENKAKGTHIFDNTLGKHHRGGTAKLALEVGLGWQMFKLKGCMNERQRPSEYSEFRLLQGVWPHFGQSAKREEPRDEPEQVCKDQITPSLDCIVQFQKERDVISGIAGESLWSRQQGKGWVGGELIRDKKMVEGQKI